MLFILNIIFKINVIFFLLALYKTSNKILKIWCKIKEIKV